MNRRPTGEVFVVSQHDENFQEIADDLAGRVRLRPKRLSWSDVISDHVGENTRAVLMFDDPPSGRPSSTVRTLREVLDDRIALCILAKGTPAQRETRQFYKAGAALVSEWPRERESFARHLSELLSLRLVRGKADEPSKALARAVKARLRAHHPSLAGLRITAREGHIEVSGELTTLWRKRQAHSIVAKTPGVRSADLSSVVVQPARVPRKKLHEAVSSIVSAVSAHPKSVTASVRNQVVTLAGTVDDAEELERIEALVVNVRGVREIRNLLVVDRVAGVRDDKAARDISRALIGRWPDVAWQVDVVGGRCVVAGQVSLLEDKLAALNVAKGLAQRGVLDKVEVRPTQ